MREMNRQTKERSGLGFGALFGFRCFKHMDASTLVEALTATLSPDRAQRDLGESTLYSNTEVPQFPVQLLQVCAQPDLDVSLRLAGRTIPENATSHNCNHAIRSIAFLEEHHGSALECPPGAWQL